MKGVGSEPETSKSQIPPCADYWDRSQHISVVISPGNFGNRIEEFQVRRVGMWVIVGSNIMAIIKCVRYDRLFVHAWRGSTPDIGSLSIQLPSGRLPLYSHVDASISEVNGSSEFQSADQHQRIDCLEM